MGATTRRSAELDRRVLRQHAKTPWGRPAADAFDALLHRAGRQSLRRRPGRRQRRPADRARQLGRERHRAGHPDGEKLDAAGAVDVHAGRCASTRSIRATPARRTMLRLRRWRRTTPAPEIPARRCRARILEVETVDSGRLPGRATPRPGTTCARYHGDRAATAGASRRLRLAAHPLRAEIRGDSSARNADCIPDDLLLKVTPPRVPRQQVRAAAPADRPRRAARPPGHPGAGAGRLRQDLAAGAVAPRAPGARPRAWRGCRRRPQDDADALRAEPGAGGPRRRRPADLRPHPARRRPRRPAWRA